MNAFDNDTPNEDDKIWDALADTMISTTEEVVKKMAAIEKRLDATHAILEDQ